MQKQEIRMNLPKNIIGSFSVNTFTLKDNSQDYNKALASSV